jgi:hypothetical protein
MTLICCLLHEPPRRGKPRNDVGKCKQGRGGIVRLAEGPWALYKELRIAMNPSLESLCTPSSLLRTS